MKHLGLTVEEPSAERNPMHTFLMEHGELRATELWNWNRLAEVDIVLFRVVGAMGPYTAALDDAPFVVDYETARIDSTSFYAYVEHETREEDRGLREPFLEQRVLPIPPIEFDEDGTVSMGLVGRSADVQAALDSFPEEFDVRVDRIESYEQGVSAFAALLTDRQREALRIAVNLGYYDVPRTASVDDVAAELGCASSTASNHLRKAQARLVRHVMSQ